MTIRTARSRTSGEHFAVCILVINPGSEWVGPSTNPARFTEFKVARPGASWSLENAQLQRLQTGMAPGVIQISSSVKLLRNKAPVPAVVVAADVTAATRLQGLGSFDDVQGAKA